MVVEEINYIILCLFAVLSFVSIAAGNIFLGISVLLFFICIYKKKVTININIKRYYYAIAVFVITMLLSALFSGNIEYGLKRWADMWIWRFMPFIIITCCIGKQVCVKILRASCLGISIGILCLIYQGVSGDSRAAGFFGHPMTFAGYLCMYLPLFLIGYFDGLFGTKYKYISGIMFLAGIAALIFNGTRGAWIAALFTLGILLLHYMFENKRNFIVGIVLIVICGGILVNNASFMHRVATITNNKYQSNSERILIWNSAWNMFKDHPVLGVGLGQYKDNYQKKYISPLAKEHYLEHAHNNFLQMLAENGIVGFIGFISMFCYIIGHNFKKFLREKNIYSLAICAVTITLLLQGFTEFNFGNSAVVKAYWLILGCLVVLENNMEKDIKNRKAVL